MMKTKSYWIGGLLVVILGASNAFHGPIAARKQSTTRLNNFFKNLLNEAFENDPSLSQSDLRTGQLDEEDKQQQGDNDWMGLPQQFSSVQNSGRRRRRQRQSQLVDQLQPKPTPRSVPTATTSLFPPPAKDTTTTTTDASIDERLVGSKFLLNLYLAGVSERDPSNNLYGSRVNISSRDKATGLDLPSEPTCQVEIEFLENQKCRVADSCFTDGDTLGDYTTSSVSAGSGGDNVMMIHGVRFRMYVLGYSKTVETRGTITQVAWSKQPQVSRQVSNSYNIPEGWVYGDIQLEPVSKFGSLALKGEGTLKLEKKMGLLGVATKLIPCGKFTAQRVRDD